MSSLTISTSGVHRGIARCAGIDVFNPQSLTGDPIENLGGYAEACLSALESKDFVYVHVSMPYFDRKMEIQAAVKVIEKFDEEVIGPLRKSMASREDSRLLVVCNHDDEEVRAHTDFPTPYIYWEKDGARTSSTQNSFDEIQATQGVMREALRMFSRLLPVKAT